MQPHTHTVKFFLFLFFPVLKLAQCAKKAFVSVFPDTAGIEDDYIGFIPEDACTYPFSISSPAMTSESCSFI